ncbi:unextended protein [Daphnia magna]|uniref:unextended protein n=1 Tax=Daphnia magna TaxID=35525 RepID=UPI001E1BDB44|nr:unextended protein [Daphnia magna]XP_032796852.2 unextended protein [Daphnia magna]XP_045035369.1 unextended protein [Daphnia magna]XP_045035370.1 unextended protein [Daphnia magna]
MDAAGTILTVLLLLLLIFPLGTDSLAVTRNRSSRSVSSTPLLLDEPTHQVATNDDDNDDSFVYKVVNSVTTTDASEATTQQLPLTGSRPPNNSNYYYSIRSAFIAGLRVEDVDKGVTYDADGTPIVQAGKPVTVRLFGDDFSQDSQFRFVMTARQRGDDCDDLPFFVAVNVTKNSLTSFSALIAFRVPSLSDLVKYSSTSSNETEEAPAFYVCSMAMAFDGRVHWIHQGEEPGVRLRTYEKLLPLWLQMVIIAILLSLSGLFSGLNLGLMALDRTDLKIYQNTGSDKEKRYARAITPVRNHGNYLLCTLLLGNVLVNSSLTILLDDLTSGIIAIVGSTMGIVIFGEIVPQAICSRHGLAVGAHTVWITKFFMLLTFPLSYPISLILNLILGEEIGAYYNRERLKELIKVTNEYHDLEKEEINIISGALELRKKTVGNIMTRLDDIFMLNYESVLDFETVSEILKQGFSRVPIYDRVRNNIVGLLFIKELALVDPEDAVPVKTLCKFYQRECNFVFDDTTLDVVFKDFKEGHKGHMAFVQRVNSSGDGDPFYETVGLVTLEDVIEELIQAEIVDETDVWIDNRSKRRREKSRMLQDFSSFAVQYRVQANHKISPQLALSAFQFLSSSVDPFHPNWISENVLRRLVQQGPVVQFIRFNKNSNKMRVKDDPDCDSTLPDVNFIYQQGKPADYFVLILEGRVEVTVGKESLVFESGPFSHFGSYALNLTTDGVAELDELGETTRPLVKSRRGNGTHPARAFSISEGGVISGGLAGQQSPLPPGAHQMFVSDYTVRAMTDVTYLRISRFLYQAARSATLLERAQMTLGNNRLSIDSANATAESSQFTSPSNSAEPSQRYSDASTENPSIEDHVRESVTCSDETISMKDLP